MLKGARRSLRADPGLTLGGPQGRDLRKGQAHLQKMLLASSVHAQGCHGLLLPLLGDGNKHGCW